jgi:hypothetical protein
MNITGLSVSFPSFELSGSRGLSAAALESAAAVPQDGSPRISKLGRYMMQLEELQQSDPTKFKEVTSDIAKRLREAAQKASDDGDTRTSELLTDLAEKFEQASETGTLPELRPPGPPPMGRPPEAEASASSAETTDDDSAEDLTLTAADLAQLKRLLELFQSNGANPFDTLTGILDEVFASQLS